MSDVVSRYLAKISSGTHVNHPAASEASRNHRPPSPGDRHAEAVSEALVAQSNFGTHQEPRP